MRRLVLLVAAVLALLLVPAVPASAGVSGSVSVLPSSVLVYGGHVDLSSTVSGSLGSGDYMLVSTGCYQPDFSGTQVWYTYTLGTSASFPLVGPNWPGGAAKCSAVLTWVQTRGSRTVSYHYISTAYYDVSA